MKTVDYYFAAISPWMFLGHDRFVKIARDAGASVAVKPMNIGEVFPVSGGLPLSKRAPQRQAYRLVELARWSEFLGIRMNLQPKYFPANGDLAACWILAADEIGTDQALALTGAMRRDLALPFARQEPGPMAAPIPGYHLVRGSLLEKAGDLAGAERAYREALRLDPTQLESAVNLGAVLNARGDPKAAIAVLTPVIEAHPRAEGARRNRALAHLLRKDESAAATDLATAFAVAPRAPVAQLLEQLARARGDLQGAARWAAEVARLEPASAPR
jgi:tetratricopeptide (TPR) repeat protein